jgi:hypothetical protein
MNPDISAVFKIRQQRQVKLDKKWFQFKIKYIVRFNPAGMIVEWLLQYSDLSIIVRNKITPWLSGEPFTLKHVTVFLGNNFLRS